MLNRDMTSVLEHLLHPLHPESRYAVDFSEIYSFLYPEKTAGEMGVFDDETPYAERVVQREALHYIFYDSPRPPVLLPSYAIEMQSLLTRLRTGMLDDMMQLAYRSLRELETTLLLPEIAELIGVATNLDRPEELSDDGVQRAWDVFSKHAASLLLLTQEHVAPPIERISHLLENGRLSDLRDARNSTYPPDVGVRDRWFTKLVAMRGRDKAGASYLDASAMATLYTLNRVLGAQGPFRLVIITRSEAMHAVFEREYAEKLWEDAGGYILRHPRTFKPLFRRFSDEEQMREDLKQRQESVRLFIDGATQRLRSHETLSDEEANAFLDQIAKIRAAWQQSETLSSATLINSAEVHVPEAAAKRQKLIIALKMLRNRQEFEDRLSRRLSELLVGFERQHESLGFALQTDDAELRDQPDGDVRPRSYEGKVVLRSGRYWLPCSLQFTSDELSLWAESLRKNSDVNWTGIVGFLQSGLRGDADYERLLAMSYLLASLDRWHAAEQFCEHAIGQPLISVPRHEGHYFMAICKRMQKESPERFSQALDHLDIAERTKRTWKGDAEYEDPRYITERGTQIFLWNAEATRHPHQEHWKERRPPRIIEAKNLWTKALRLVRDDLNLQLQLHNNLCFYYCETEGPLDEKEIRYHLNKLVSVQKEIEPLPESQNPLVLDTIAMARLRLHRIHADGERLTDACHRLKEAIANRELLTKQRATLEEHLSMIERELGGANVSA